ncbi:MAG: hypothetical protein IK041_04165 [Bacteroidales bacterium]|nr:hypothetical protein [Bacteroidales bacterium]
MKRFFLAVICILAIAGCGRNKKQASDNPDANPVQTISSENKAETTAAEEVKHEYLSQDLATFDLYGQVQSVSYSQEHVYPVSVEFDSDGKLIAIQRIDSEGTAEEAVYSRDANGRIESIRYESDSSWETLLRYGDGEGFQAPVVVTNSNMTGNYTEETYRRNADGYVTSLSVEEYIHFEKVEDNDPRTIEFSDYDEKGNWQKCTTKWGEYTSVLTRTIAYFK